jgi:AAA+ superfamily predicted ATPase
MKELKPVDQIEVQVLVATPMSWARAWNTLRQSKPELFKDLEPDDNQESEVTTAELNQVSKSAGASKSAAALVQAKQRELVKQYVQDWGFSHRQAFEEAKKNHPNVFAVDAVDLSTVQRSA